MKDTSRYVGAVYRNIYKNRTCSRTQIAKELGISLPTVTQNLNNLIQGGLVYEAGEFESTGGRKANMFRIVPDSRLSVGVDITKAFIAIVLVDLNLNVLDSVRNDVEFENTEAYFRIVSEMLQGLLKKNRLTCEKLCGIGISLPAIIARDQKTVAFAKVIDLPADFYRKIASWIPGNFLFFNDANSAGWVETWNREDEQPMVYLSLSNSVGGAIMMQKQVYTGSNWRGAEFGHMCLVPRGRKCYCGMEGCVDAYCSAKVLSDFSGGNLELFFEKLKKEESEGLRRVLEEYLDDLAMTVINLRMCFDCEVVLGGIAGPFLEDYLDQIRERVEKRSTFGEAADFLRICSQHEEPSAVGAALYFVDEYINSL